jgi:hypothetical protein
MGRSSTAQGRPGMRADVGVIGDRIAAIGVIREKGTA